MLRIIVGLTLLFASPLQAAELVFTGPAISHHSEEGYNSWHPGVGFAIQAGDKWVHGPLAHYMASDSYSEDCWWAFYTLARRFGGRDTAFLDFGAGAGALQKDNYRNGDVSPIVLPYIEVGKGLFSMMASAKPATKNRPVWAVFGILRIKIWEW